MADRIGDRSTVGGWKPYPKKVCLGFLHSFGVSFVMVSSPGLPDLWVLVPLMSSALVIGVIGHW
eukprot:1153181-Pelagomonas_calceolata.AAC.5